MTCLIALLSTGKGSWSEVSQIIRSGSWRKIILVTNTFGVEKFQPDDKTRLIITNFEVDILNLKKDLEKKLSESELGFEVALNLSSGSGKEHMALLAAVMSLGVGFRLITSATGKIEII
jgi:hypothetical protein